MKKEKEEEWTKLVFAFYDAESAKESADKLLRRLSELFSLADSTSQVLTLWDCFNNSVKEGLLNKNEMSWRKFFEIAFNFAKSRGEAMNIFRRLNKSNCLDCREAEITFEKVLSFCDSQQAAADVILNLIYMGNGDCYCGANPRGIGYFKYAKWFHKCLDRGLELPEKI